MKRLNKKRLIISAAAVTATIAVIISALTALRERDSIRIGEPVYSYMKGLKMEWTDGVKLVREDGTTYMRTGGKKQELQDCPLLTEDGCIILQKSCSFNKTEGDFYRVDYFTKIGQDIEGVYFTRRNQLTRNVSGFLYDNDDTYIFLEKARLHLDGERTIEIAPLSVVQVEYMFSIQIFGPGVETVYEMQMMPEMYAEFEGGQKVDLATDCYYDKTGKWRLLYLPLDALGEIRKGAGRG